MKKRHVIAGCIIVAFAIFSVIIFRNALTPYVTFAQAKKMQANVQVRGTLAASEPISSVDGGKMIRFILQDEAGEAVPVLYKGVKPDGMEHATSIVAIGQYERDLFIAEKLLVKCPSKYQGSVKKS
jgi:cytochrome c-type biogenesis protein CcmE